MTKNMFLQIDTHDNLIVALQPLAKGNRLRVGRHAIELIDDIPEKHKFALKDLDQGDLAVMYGVIVGRAKRPIRCGELITTDNLDHATTEYRETHEPYQWQAPLPYPESSTQFMGIRRPDGKVGTANYWIFVPLVFCSNQELNELKKVLPPALGYGSSSRYAHFTEELVKQIKTKGAPVDPVISLDSFDPQPEPLFPRVDGLRFLTHHMGCGSTPDEAEELVELLANYITHPNTAGATVVSLGCQKAEVKALQAAIVRRDPAATKPVFYYDRQSWAEPVDMLEAIIRQTLISLHQANELSRREPVPVSELVIGVECGGSDGFSGISANPVIGRAMDHLVGKGGSVILAEFPELCGVENEIVSRCAEPELGSRFLELMKSYRKRVQAVGFDFDQNPSPGNIRDGLITDAMKSAGAAKKGGTSPVVDVFDYPGQASKHGLNLLCTPGGDVESTTALAGAGANLIIFSTGLGTPTGNPIVPVLKVSSNSDMARRLEYMIDLDTGAIISGEKSLDKLGAELEKLCVETASGSYRAKAVRLNQEDFIPWKRGMSL
ncbi:MAG: altronate dehydratase family protein [Desulfofustis sp.]|nr:altronate dehydratase family protein [Desulfofustis sp.]